MPWYYNIIWIFLLALLFTILVIRMQKKLLRLWRTVSSKEIVFYRQLEAVAKLFYEHRELIRNDDNKDQFRYLTRYRKKRVRSLLLSTRQELFKAINLIYDDIEHTEDETLKIVKKKFKDLQKVRRIYNSQVLLYNQTISVFPTRYLALRMNLELKEYFG
jgi:hypothetical protein